MTHSSINPKAYRTWLKELRSTIQQAQIKASLSVNRELLALYWELGKAIVHKQRENGWGTQVIEQLARDLKIEFPKMKGFSRRNLYAIRQWHIFYSTEDQIVPQLVAQIPWGHNRLIISKIKNIEEAIFYVNKTIEHNWSRSILELQIESGLFQRQGALTHNFEATLPKIQSDLAKEILKDPYHLAFLTLDAEAKERDIQKQLTTHITRFLLELGAGFAFLGEEFEIRVGENDRRIDLMFYHLKLRCYIAVELKMTEFRPEYSGKMNFYLNAIDDIMKTDLDQPSIGIILCKSKDKTVVEYALRGIDRPIGVSEFQLMEKLPEDLKNNLPTIQQLESELDKFDESKT